MYMIDEIISLSTKVTETEHHTTLAQPPLEMEAEFVASEKPHAVCLPMPVQGHINPTLKLAKLLHSKGFSITFVYSEFDRDRLLKSGGAEALKGLEDFRFATMSDGLPSSDLDSNRHLPSLCDSLRKTGLGHFRKLLSKLNEEGPRVRLVVYDGFMSFGHQAATELEIPDVMFWTASASGLLAYLHYPHLVEKGIVPLKDESYLINGYLDTPVDWIPGMKDICLRNLPALLRTTDPNDIFFNYAKDDSQEAYNASAIICNTLDDLEHDILSTLSSMLPRIYTLGSVSMLCEQVSVHSAISTSSFWKEDIRCIEWLNQRDPKSVVYVNFGSMIVVPAEHLLEFARGLAKSNHFFLWVIRSDLVSGDVAILPEDFMEETEGRGLVVCWCNQEQMLSHPSIGAFLTHCGWNSILEGIAGGVPMLCWPFFAEQTTNCHYICKHWGIGVELDEDVKKEQVECVIREVMEGEKGQKLRKKSTEWKEKAEKATREGGSSYSNMNKIFNELLSSVKV